MRAQLKTLLKPLNTIECCSVRGVSGGPSIGPLMPCDASLSDSYTRGCFSSLAEMETLREIYL